MKKTCLKCEQLAIWNYAPNNKYHYCDEHVPRGCPCNYKEGQLDVENPELELDEQGRDLPCVEYDYNEEGFNE